MDELIKAARVRDDIVLIVGDLGYSLIEPFADEFPERFFNAGIAEQNMMGMAAGMASENMHVFTYSIGNFPTWRCAEQIRNDVDYHNLNVTNVVSGGGLAYGALGYSHHVVQDFAIMRVMQNMTIASPCDPNEVRSCMRYILSNQKPTYLRLGKSGEQNIHKNIPLISAGELIKIRERRRKKAIIITGTVLNEAIELMKYKQYCEYDVISLPLWSVHTKDKISNSIKEYRKIIILENHITEGGFASYILEVITKNKLSVNVIIKALDVNVCGLVGSEKCLNKIGGLYEN